MFRAEVVLEGLKGMWAKHHMSAAIFLCGKLLHGFVLD